ncbi:MAG: hypothetical protein ACMG6E_05085 [Candidatus Roizmanbacteria bacterium]
MANLNLESSISNLLYALNNDDANIKKLAILAFLDAAMIEVYEKQNDLFRKPLTLFGRSLIKYWIHVDSCLQTRQIMWTRIAATYLCLLAKGLDKGLARNFCATLLQLEPDYDLKPSTIGTSIGTGLDMSDPTEEEKDPNYRKILSVAIEQMRQSPILDKKYLPPLSFLNSCTDGKKNE